MEAPRLDSLGRVIDFGVIKQLVGGWINDNWDHNLLLNELDPLLHQQWFCDTEQHYPMAGNPTAENMARLLFVEAENLLNGTGLKVVSVRIWETPSCYADFR